MKNTIYNNAKECLISVAKEAKRLNKKDKPMVRQIINDQADEIHRQIDFHCMKGAYSEYKATQYKNWISILACRLHP